LDSGNVRETLRSVGMVFERVQNSYPYPLARSARAYLAAGSRREEYEAGLVIAERLFVLLGVLSLTWARALGIGNRAVTQWGKGLRGGITLGRWLSTAREIAEDARRNMHELGGLASALSPRQSSSVGRKHSLDTLLEMRNRDAHGGPPHGEVELAEALSVLTPSLEEALSTAEFMSTTDLLMIAECKLRRYEPNFDIAALRLSGDHPDFQPMRLTSSGAFLEGSLVLRSGTQAFDLLPFALVDDCPKCGRREVFYPSRMSGTDAVFVSFESNHQLIDSKWVPELIGEAKPMALTRSVGVPSQVAVARSTRREDDEVTHTEAEDTDTTVQTRDLRARGLPELKPPVPPPPPPPQSPTVRPSTATDERAPAPRRGTEPQRDPSSSDDFYSQESPPRGRESEQPLGPELLRPHQPETSRYRSLGQRGAARAIDLVVSFALLILAIVPVGLVDGIFSNSQESLSPGEEATLSGLATALVLLLWIVASLAYEVISTVKFSATLGKKAMKIRIVTRFGENPGIAVSSIRSVAAIVLLTLFPMTVLDILWPVWDPKGEMLHDKVAGTRVVQQ
jgi:uncharacterized RDD family membrane protein YckC